MGVFTPDACGGKESRVRSLNPRPPSASLEKIIPNREPMSLIQGATPWGGPEEDRVDTLLSAMIQASIHEGGPDTLVPQSGNYINAADVSVPLEVTGGVGKLLDQAEPQGTHQRAAGGSYPTPPGGTRSQPIRHPRRTAFLELRFGLDRRV
jgi:hypothetical protein